MDPSAQAAELPTPKTTETVHAIPSVVELTRRMVKGDELAYRHFFNAFVPRLSRYLLVVTNGEESGVQDAIQGTLSRVVRHIRAFDDEEVFWSWLTVLARSALADDRKKARRYFAFLDRFTQHSVAEPHLRNLSAEGDARLSALLERAMAQLPPGERRLLELKYTQGATVDAIALAEGSSSKAIESRLGRIRQKLRTAILQGLKDEPTG